MRDIEKYFLYIILIILWFSVFYLDYQFQIEKTKVELTIDKFQQDIWDINRRIAKESE
jgi:hypothetical protein